MFAKIIWKNTPDIFSRFVRSIRSIKIYRTGTMTQQTMIGVKSDPDVPEAVVVCIFGQVKVLFGAVDEGVGSVVVPLCRGPHVNFGVVVGIVGVVA
jgi:hypothetical protein